MDKGHWSFEGRGGLSEALTSLTDEQLQLVIDFTQQVLESSDLDAITSILKWRHDARLASLIELVSEIDDDDLDQLLFMAEDFYSDVVRRSDSGNPQ